VLGELSPRAQVLAFSATYTQELVSRIESITGRSNFMTACLNKDRKNREGSGRQVGRAPQQALGEEEEVVLAGDRDMGDSDTALDQDLVSLKRIRQFYWQLPSPKPEKREEGEGGDVDSSSSSSAAGAFHTQKQCRRGYHAGNDLGVSAARAKIGFLIDRVLCTFSFDQCILFCNNKSHGQMLVRSLAREGYKTQYLCGEMAQSARSSCMASMRSGRIRILVASDLVSRGIDLDRVSLVVCFDLPRAGATLLHRVGRTGRFGAQGTCVHLLGDIHSGDKERLFGLLAQAGAVRAKVEHLMTFLGEQPTQPDADADADALHNNSQAEGGSLHQEANSTPPQQTTSGGVSDASAASSSGRRTLKKTQEQEEEEEALAPVQALDVDSLPEHVQRWIWWQWRYTWWCHLKNQQQQQQRGFTSVGKQ
jgi:superfamily II DNA/RNA helicase